MAVDVPWQKAEKLAKFRVSDRVPEGLTLITEDTQID